MDRESPMITCAYCFNILDDPATLPCRHSFCLKCLKSKIDGAVNGDGVTCGLCNAHHPSINIRTVHDLVDTNLQTQITRLTEGYDQRPMCQWCEESPATMYCHDCAYALCSECNIAVHKNSAKKSHAPGPLQDVRTAKQTTKKCTVRGHEEYRLEFYCVQCEALCCAYCLQVGPHRQHDSVQVSQAAQEVRLQMGRDLENMGQVKTRIEGMASELNRVSGQYQDSYDHVEAAITDRFNAFRQQLAQKEVEVRRTIANLREIGDLSLAESRQQYARKLNSINVAALAYRRLQHGGADYEVLQNRATMSAFLKMDVPQVSGSGFRLSDLGDLNLAGLNIALDLNTIPAEGSGPVSRGLAMQRRRQPLFTFQPHPDVEVSEREDGVLMRCSERAHSHQVGIRPVETFEALKSVWRENNGELSWRVRLDLMNESFIGLVEFSQGHQAEGFYWRPMRQGQFEGKVGRATHVLRSLPVCRTGDIVKLTYDTNTLSVRLSINNIDRGVILSDVPANVSPCFIFAPGEALTLMN